MRAGRLTGRALAPVLVLVVAATVGCTAPAAGRARVAATAVVPSAAVENGPPPTAASVGAARGPFAYTTRRVTGAGFAGGVLYTPTAEGTFGGILLLPPFLFNSATLEPFAQRYASNGFVVLAMDARTVADFPSARAQQGRAALTALKQQPKVDTSRIGVGGYSMGGGATMEVINTDQTVKAAVPMVPWDTMRNFGRVRTPTMILAASGDVVAPVAQHARPFYNSIPAGVPKGLAVAPGSHVMPTTPPAGVTQLAVAWMKVFVDGDLRYRPFISSAPGVKLETASLPQA